MQKSDEPQDPRGLLARDALLPGEDARELAELREGESACDGVECSTNGVKMWKHATLRGKEQDRLKAGLQTGYAFARSPAFRRSGLIFTPFECSTLEAGSVAETGNETGLPADGILRNEANLEPEPAAAMPPPRLAQAELRNEANCAPPDRGPGAGMPPGRASEADSAGPPEGLKPAEGSATRN